MKKKKAKKKIATPRTVKHEIVVSVQSQVPTVDEIAQPMKEGKELAITKTWVSDKQIMRMVQKTPPQFVYTRPAKGGGRWSYVTGSYVEKVLNFVFGFMWDFEVMSTEEKYGQVIVRGKLTVKDPQGHSITKMQSGRADIKFKKGTTIPMDYGNDEKAATTDSLKKCASLLGIASDIYGKMEYKQETAQEPRESHAAPQLPSPKNQEPLYCHGASRSGCTDGAEINQSTAEYSKKVYGRQLCANCQKLVKPLQKA